MDIAARTMIGQKDFYAKEFLLWLWYMIETKNGEFTTEDNIMLFLSIENKIVLTDLLGSEELLFKGEYPSESLEAHYALKQGKTIKELKLKIVKGVSDKLDDIQYEWSFNFRASEFKISGLKLPHVDSKRFYDKLKERIFFLEEFYDYLRDIYKQFLTLRLDSDLWKTTFTEIKTWIDE